jgi:hypothetical protein
MLAIAAKLTYFIITSRTLGRDTSTSRTVNSIRIEEAVSIKEIRKATSTFLKLCQWLTQYFIYYRPALTSFSTFKCIIMEAINLAIRISSPSGLLTPKLPLKAA